jgi:aspartyl-tRNA(Asn)/glutamyl-tRNA(Gln) amidotransferase subunit A
MAPRGIESMRTDGEALRLHERYKRGEVSPVEIARAQLDVIPGLNRSVNAFVLVDDAVTMEMARASEARYRRGEPIGPMDGIPVTIKDTLNVAGWPTRRGSRTTSEASVPTDAVSIARLRTSGAVFLGKTTTPEFAWKGLTESPLYGVTTNPLDPDRHAGGSSGGGDGIGTRDRRHRHRCGGIGSHSCGVLRRRRVQADLRDHSARSVSRGILATSAYRTDRA